jgi:hypothetical protein
LDSPAALPITTHFGHRCLTKERPGREGAGAVRQAVAPFHSATCSIAKCPTPSFSASGTRGITNSWPAILHECSDRAAYEDDPVWKAERAAESNWTKPRPSSIEIARMETAIVWPARYLDHVPQLLRTVQAVGLSRARDRDIAHAARKLGLPGRLARRWNREGLELIAAGLRRDGVAVF